MRLQPVHDLITLIYRKHHRQFLETHIYDLGLRPYVRGLGNIYYTNTLFHFQLISAISILRTVLSQDHCVSNTVLCCVHFRRPSFGIPFRLDTVIFFLVT